MAAWRPNVPIASTTWEFRPSSRAQSAYVVVYQVYQVLLVREEAQISGDFAYPSIPASSKQPERLRYPHIWSPKTHSFAYCTLEEIAPHGAAIIIIDCRALHEAETSTLISLKVSPTSRIAHWRARLPHRRRIIIILTRHLLHRDKRRHRGRLLRRKTSTGTGITIPADLTRSSAD